MRIAFESIRFDIDIDIDTHSISIRIAMHSNRFELVSIFSLAELTVHIVDGTAKQIENNAEERI